MTVVRDYRALLSEWYWSVPVGSQPAARPTFLTYSFQEQSSDYTRLHNPDGAATFSPLTEVEREVVRSALTAWESVSGVKFFETTTSEGDINFGFYQLDLFGYATAAGIGGYPSAGAYVDTTGQPKVYGRQTSYDAGDVKFDIDYRAQSSFASDFMHVALHEIGHALGLKHPFDDDPVLSPDLDTGRNTVMSYDQTDLAVTLGPFDIGAVQAIYGPAGSDGTHVASWSWNAVSETLTQTGTEATELIRGTSSDDVIYSMGGQDAVVTDQGDDLIVLAGVPASVNAGTGLDKVVTGLTYSTTMQMGGEQASEFRWISIGSDIMSLISVERLEFENGNIAFDLGGNAGQMYRIYQAAFNRKPDSEGLGYWIREFDAGKGDLAWVANNFIVSNEFEATYGSPVTVTDHQFITLLYSNVLHRAPDPAGLAYWQNEVSNGLSRERMLASFSESAENQSNVIGVIEGGIFYI